MGFYIVPNQNAASYGVHRYLLGSILLKLPEVIVFEEKFN